MINPRPKQFSIATCSPLTAAASLGKLFSRNTISFVLRENALTKEAISRSVESVPSLEHATTSRQFIEQWNTLADDLGNRTVELLQRSARSRSGPGSTRRIDQVARNPTLPTANCQLPNAKRQTQSSLMLISQHLTPWLPRWSRTTSHYRSAEFYCPETPQTVALQHMIRYAASQHFPLISINPLENTHVQHRF